MTSERKSLLWVAGLLFAAAAGVGTYGGVVIRRGYYEDHDKTGRRISTTRGPEAVAWGWTLVAGGAATLAWAGMLAFPPVPLPRVHHFGLVGLAFLAIATVFLLRMPFPPDTRAKAFYAALGFMAVAAAVLALLRERGLPVVGAALAVGVCATLYAWGLKGFEGLMLSLMALMLLGLHVGVYVKLMRMPRTPA
jgi:hypothetical protein